MGVVGLLQTPEIGRFITLIVRRGVQKMLN